MSAKSLTIRILTPETTLYEGAAEAVSLPGTLGPFVVLPGHAPIISTLVKGSVSIEDGQNTSLAIKAGVVKVKDNNITVCAEV